MILFPLGRISGYGSVWLERIVRDDEAAGSNPVTPIEKEKRRNSGSVAFLVQDRLAQTCLHKFVFDDHKDIIGSSACESYLELESVL